MSLTESRRLKRQHVSVTSLCVNKTGACKKEKRKRDNLYIFSFFIYPKEF